MKLALTLLFALTTVVNAPVACAHARGMDAKPTEHHIAGENEHASMSHGAGHHQHTDGAAPEHQKPHQDCASDCDGGDGCEGCTIGATAVLMQDGETPHAAPATVLAEIRDTHNGAGFAADPPPPRAL